MRHLHILPWFLVSPRKTACVILPHSFYNLSPRKIREVATTNGEGNLIILLTTKQEPIKVLGVRQSYYQLLKSGVYVSFFQSTLKFLLFTRIH